MNNKRVANSTIKVFLLSATSMVFGFVRQILIAGKFGTTSQTDAFYMAYNIQNVLFSSLISSFATILIPEYIEKKKDESLVKDDEFVSGYFTLTSFIVFTISIIVFFFSGNFVNIFAPGFRPESKGITELFLKILLILPAFININSLSTAILNADKEYVGVQIRGIIANTFAIGIIFFFSNKWGINALIISVIASQILQSVITYIKLRKAKKISVDFRCYRSDISKALIGMIPLIGGIALAESQSVVDNFFASQLPIGCVSAISYATALMPFFSLFFYTPISTVIFPEIWEKIAHNLDFKRIITSGYKIMLMLIVPFTIGTFLLSKEIVSIVYFRGNFTLDAMENTASILGFYVLCLAITSSVNYFSTVFIAKKMFHVSVLSGIVTLIVNIIGNTLLIDKYGIVGLAASSAIAQAVNLLIQQIWLYKICNCINYKEILCTLRNTGIAGVIMFGVGKIFMQYLSSINLYSKTIIVVIFCAMTYAFVLKLIRDNDYNMLKKFILDIKLK